MKNKKYANIWIAAGINLAVLLITIISGTIKFEVSDDFIMSTVASGAMGGVPEPYIMFMSPIAGWILKWQYTAIPWINWYTWNQIILIFLSETIIGSAILKKRTKLSLFLALSFILITSMDLYQLMQFTKTSAVILAAGFFLLYFYIRSDHLIDLAGAILLIFTGSIIRFQPLFLILPLAFVTYLILFGKKIFKAKAAYISLFGVFCLIGLLTGVKSLVYQLDPAQQIYADFHSLRSDIIDYPYPIYEEIEDELENIGVSKNDYYSFTTWDFSDTEVFTNEKMEGMLGVLKEYRKSTRPTLKSVLREMYYQAFWTYVVFWPIVLSLIILLIGNPKEFLKSLFLGITVIGLVMCTYFMGRVVYRVEYSILMMYFAFVMLVLSEVRLNPKMNSRNAGWIWIGLSLVLILYRIYYWIPDHENPDKFPDMNISWANNPSKYRYSFNQDDFADFNALTAGGGIYYLEFNTAIQSYYLQFNPLLSIPEETLSNIYYLGGVDFLNPARQNALAKNNLQGNITDLNREDVYLVDYAYNDLIFSFIREHYSSDYQAEPIGIYSGYPVFKISW